MKKILALTIWVTSIFDIALSSSGQTNDPVLLWNKTLLTIVRTPGAQPATIHSTRSFAILHTAIFDAVNAIDGSRTPYLVRLPDVSPFASKEAAAAAAGHAVLVALYPAFKSPVDDSFAQYLAQIGDDDAKAEGIAAGEAVASQILAQRSNDNASNQPVHYVFGTKPGEYQSTPPDFPAQPQFTHWSAVRPFALLSAAQFRPGPPPALADEAYSDGLNEIKSLGVTNSVVATSDQAVTGRFWNGPIQNYWNEIAQTVVEAYGLSTAQSARLFALLNLTLADSVIAFYDAKYSYNFWRPVTAVRAADTDNNPATQADPNWVPLGGKTAPDPSYPGAHAVISAAAAEVLSSFLQTDTFSLKVKSEVLAGVERSFEKFSAAAEEATLSRIFAGQHFRFDLVAGQLLGREVADFVVSNLYSVVEAPPSQFLVHNLVSDLAGMADVTDTNLVNPWGIAFSQTSAFWISDNHAGLSTIYDGTGKIVPPRVSIPPPGAAEPPAAPTGIVFNGTTNFVVGSNQAAKFIFATEDGTISAWASGVNASLAVDNSGSDAVYKGLALLTSSDGSYLYASDFHNGKVDIFDAQFKPATFTNAFVDPGIPPGFAPFGIENVGNNIFVTYAMQDSERADDVGGDGNGFVSVFDARGNFLRRLASNGPLNSPWGIAIAPATFGQFAGDILIGNFGDGRINAFDFVTGPFKGSLMRTGGDPISIPGLWGLKFGNGAGAGDTNALFFTAGIPGGGVIEDHGLFGRITTVVRPHFSSIVPGTGGLTLNWSGGAGASYIVQRKTGLSDTNWITITTTTNTSALVESPGRSGFFRIMSQ